MAKKRICHRCGAEGDLKFSHCLLCSASFRGRLPCPGCGLALPTASKQPCPNCNSDLVKWRLKKRTENTGLPFGSDGMLIMPGKK